MFLVPKQKLGNEGADWGNHRLKGGSDCFAIWGGLTAKGLLGHTMMMPAG
jgi:hypothetical protein